MAHYARMLTLCTLVVTTAAQAQLTTNSSGSLFPQPIDTRQPGLALHMVVQAQGTFGIGAPIRMFAYSDSVMSGLAAPGGWPLADGRLLPIQGYQSLFSQLGTTYGGNAVNDFALPDARGRALMGETGQFPRGTVSGSNTVTLTAANVAWHTHGYTLSPTRQTDEGTALGTGTPFAGLQPALSVYPVVLTTGIFPSRDGPFAAAAVSPTAGYISQLQFLSVPPLGSQANSRGAALGALIPIAQNTALFSLMGTTYGGNGFNTFAMPDLIGRLTVGWGQGPQLTGRTLGQAFGSDAINLTGANLPPHTHTVTGRPNTGSTGAAVPFPAAQPTLTVAYFIATYGVYPNSNSISDEAGYTGEVIAMALGAEVFVPSGYLPCDGRLLSTDEYDTLFSLIGNTFGGDGVTTFALPDLRGRVPIGTHFTGPNPSMPAGTRTGAETTTLIAANLPAHVHTIPCPADFGLAGGLPGQDNEYDNNDFIAYINLFFAASPLADIGQAGGLPGADGSLDNNDFIELITRFFSPC